VRAAGAGNLRAAPAVGTGVAVFLRPRGAGSDTAAPARPGTRYTC
jgi:hypothetical protein